MDNAIAKYLGIIGNQNKSSADTVEYYLHDFEVFCASELAEAKSSDGDDKSTTNSVAEVIKRLKAGTWNDSPKEEQAYDLLGSYAAWLVSERLGIGANNERTVN